MLRNLFFSLSLLFCVHMLHAQKNKPVYERLYEAYEQYKEPTITQRRFKHDAIEPLILRLQEQPGFSVNQVGKSIGGKAIYDVSWGEGKTQVLLWSQMHGDETTATMAGMDIFNFLTHSDELNDIRETLKEHITIHFIPMLNPDGATLFQRRNLLDVDLNRDALRLTSPEAQVLKKVRDSLNADFGFNLHDQSIYYSAGLTNKPATISFLAPAFNYDKDMNKVRKNATKLIVHLNEALQHYIPGQVARYDDDFEPRAFGDNIQKWGTSLVLIESGGYHNDPEKQEIRKLNFMAILTGLYAIAEKDYRREKIRNYEEIPKNERYLYDLVVRGLQKQVEGTNHILDIAIKRLEIDYNDHQQFFSIGTIQDVGDMSTYHGYQEFDATGMVAIPGKVYPDQLRNIEDLEELDTKQLLREGYTTVAVRNLTGYEELVDSFALDITSSRTDEDNALKIGNRANFILQKDGKPMYAVVNGVITTL